MMTFLMLLGSSQSEPLDLGKSGSRARFGFNTIPKKDRVKVSIAVVLPHSMFKQREYKKIIMQSALELDGSEFEEMFDLSPYLEMVQPIPAPTEVLGKICDQVSTKLFMTFSFLRLMELWFYLKQKLNYEMMGSAVSKNNNFTLVVVLSVPVAVLESQKTIECPADVEINGF